MATFWIALGTFILGVILGGIGGVFYLRKKMTNMQMSETDIAQMARSMGMNLNQKQLSQVQKRMSNMNNKQAAGAKAKKRK
jgi:uncharacterized protein